MSSYVLNKVTLFLESVHPSILTPTLIAVAVALLSWIYIKIARGPYDMAKLNKIPGSWSMPVIGNSYNLAVPRTQFLDALKKLSRHGPISKFFLAHRPYVMLTRASGFETVMTSQKHITKSPDYAFLHPWLGTGLLNSTGEKWHSRRKMITPTFHFKILEDFLTIMNDQSKIMTDLLSSVDKDETIDIFPRITHCVLDVICESAMGTNAGAQQDSNSPYVQALFSSAAIILDRMMSPWLWSDTVFWNTSSGRRFKKDLHVLHGFTDKVIKERKEAYMKKNSCQSNAAPDNDEVLGKKRKLAFLDMLLEKSENGRVLSDMDIREEVDTFMFEGHDTTAASMASTVCLLAHHQDIQRKVQDELDTVFGDDHERPVTTEDLSQMKYIESCIKESMRVLPVVAFIMRTILEDAVIEV